MMTFVFYNIMKGQIEEDEEYRWEENVAIYYSETEEEARKLADNDFQTYEYKNANGETIVWKPYKLELVNVVDCPIPSGEQVFSRGLKTLEVESLETKFGD